MIKRGIYRRSSTSIQSNDTYNEMKIAKKKSIYHFLYVCEKIEAETTNMPCT